MAIMKSDGTLNGLHTTKAHLNSLKKIPRHYQKKAVQSVLTTFKNCDRTHIVMACGTGKTLVALWVAERLKCRRIVVFVPSLALISQLMREWLRHTSWKEVSCLAICSDEG
jgi:predicted helicase